MASSKKTKSSSSSSSSSSSRSSRSSGSKWGLNKVSFWLLCAAAIIYLIGLILSACGVNAMVVQALSNIAAAAMICIVAILAWRYVKPKPAIWKVLYFVVLLVIIAGLIVPLVVG